MFENLIDMQSHFGKLHNRPDQFVNNSFQLQALHFWHTLGKIAVAQRTYRLMGPQLARSISSFMDLVSYFDGEVLLGRGMARKFPDYGCIDCGNNLCTCGAHKKLKLACRAYDYDQYTQWSIRDYQRHLEKVYGARNKHLGFDACCQHLNSEASLLAILVVHEPEAPMPSHRVDECELELANIFSWILTLAYVKGIDLQDQVESRYQVCPDCSQLPCGCPLAVVTGDPFRTVSQTSSAD